MPHSAPHNERNRQILSAIVRAYIETGEPVSSRIDFAAARGISEPRDDPQRDGRPGRAGLSVSATHLGGACSDGGSLPFFRAAGGAQATLSPEDEDWIRGEFAAAATAEEIAERAGHVLAEVSRGLGIVVSPPIAKTVLEHMRFVLLPDGRVVVVLVSTGGNTRDKIIRPERAFTQPDLDRTAEYLNRHYAGCMLEAIRADLLTRLAKGAGAIRIAGAQRAGAVRSGNARAGISATSLH